MPASNYSGIEFEEEFNPYLEKDKKIFFTTSKLPHWNQNGKTQFVTFRLADSLPQSLLENLQSYIDTFNALNPKPWAPATANLYRKNITSKIEIFIDAGLGKCYLTDPKVRKIIADSLEKYNFEKYYLDAYVLMPNHVHLLITTDITEDYNKILSNIKRFTAREINRLVKREGKLWSENFDRIIRNEDHYRNCLSYIINNPKHLRPGEYTLGGNHPRIKSL